MLGYHSKHIKKIILLKNCNKNKTRMTKSISSEAKKYEWPPDKMNYKAVS